MQVNNFLPNYNLATTNVVNVHNIPCVNVRVKSAAALAQNTRALALRENGERYRNYLVMLANLFMALNDICGSTMLDAVDLIRKDRKLWRQNLKHTVTTAYEVYLKKDKLIKTYCTDMEIYMDFADNFTDSVSKDIVQLRLSISQVLTRLETPNRNIIAYILTAYFCIGLSCEIYLILGSWIKSLFFSELGLHYKQQNLTPVRNLWRKVVYSLISKDIEREITNDANYKLAAKILWEKVARLDIVDNAVTAAMQKNRDKFTDEQWKYYMGDEPK